MANESNAPSMASFLVRSGIVGGAALAGIDRLSAALLERSSRIAVPAPLARLLNEYLAAKYHVIDHASAYSAGAGLMIGLTYEGVRQLSAWSHRSRERRAGFDFKQEDYSLKQTPFFLRDGILGNPRPQEQVILGSDEHGQPVYLTDYARSMHLHVLGQTGSGKTRGVIEPLLLQDLLRGRGVMLVDGKAAEENHKRLLAMAAAAGRLAQVRTFSLSPYWKSHTYNPLHLVKDADPRAVAERVFSSFADDMTVPYYRDQARMFFVSLVCAFASTGKRFCMLDVAAAITNGEARSHALSLASDAKARRAVEAQLAQLGTRAGETLTGLLAAVSRYNLPIVNAYDPDIILEEEIERDGIIGFFLPANYYKELARYIGITVFQHLQQLGALRQLDRSRSQRPIYVYADEFQSFAYDGFIDAVNKLRDANISLLLSHQSLSDLEKVSKEYANGIWDNTRNRIILYQNDPDVCERIAAGLGTEKAVELTVRRTADGFLNQQAMLEGSSREVDRFRYHPGRIKALKRGQAYLAQDSSFIGTNLSVLPDLPGATLPILSPRPQCDGLRLFDIAGQGDQM